MDTRTVKPMGALEWGLLGSLSVLWGGSFFFSKVALAELPPLTLVLARVALAALALGALVRLAGLAMPRDLASWRAFAVMGTLNNLVPFSLLFWGQTHLASGLAAILTATTPVFSVLVAQCLSTGERITPARGSGVVLGLAGVVVLMGPDAVRGMALDLLAQLACLGAALCYALAGAYGRRFRGTPPTITATGQVTATTALMLPVALLVERPWLGPVPGMRTAGAVLGLVLLSTALAYVLYFRILASAGATNVLLVTFLIPVSALLLGVGILGERLDPRHFLGMALVGSGLAAIDGRAARLLTGWLGAAGPGRAAPSRGTP